MIIDKETEIIINAKTFKHYKKHGYVFLKVRDTIRIKVEHLTLNSHHKILCSCDCCGFETLITFGNYNKYIKKDLDNKYTCKKCNIVKRKNSCLKKYGTEFSSQNNDIKKKVKQTMLDRNIKFFWCRGDEIKNRIFELYGVTHISKDNDIKKKKVETCLKNYGVEYPSQNRKIKEKQEQTCLKNYGVKYPSQNYKIHEKQQKSAHSLKYHSSGLFYRGTYEKDFIDFCILNNIQIKNVKKGIKYIFKNKDKIYFPDFYYEPLNLIIEIKSSYTYECELENNIIKKEAVINNGLNFIFIINKNYEDFQQFIYQNHC
jgi:hypothetical protein